MTSNMGMCYINKTMSTSFPRIFKNSISSGVNVAIDMDFTLCGGFRPLLKQKWSRYHKHKHILLTDAI